MCISPAFLTYTGTHFQCQSLEHLHPVFTNRKYFTIVFIWASDELAQAMTIVLDHWDTWNSWWFLHWTRDFLCSILTMVHSMIFYCECNHILLCVVEKRMCGGATKFFWDNKDSIAIWPWMGKSDIPVSQFQTIQYPNISAMLWERNVRA